MFDDETFMRVPSPAGEVNGTVLLPRSKSLTQRALVVAAASGPGSIVRDPLDSEDCRLLHRALVATGCELRWDDDGIFVGERKERGGGVLFMGNNGTGVRFLLAQLAVTAGRWVVDGVPRLRERPVAGLLDALVGLGAVVEPSAEGGLPAVVVGRALTGGEVGCDPSVSSQFISALLLLGARLPAGLTVHLRADPPSRPYLDLTSAVLEAFGSAVRWSSAGDRCRVTGGCLEPAEFAVERDWSAAAFPLAAVAVAGGRVVLPGLTASSAQGDSVMLRILQSAGCEVEEGGKAVVCRGPARRRVTANLRDAPDLFPALAVVTAVHGGRLEGLGGLILKESDRLETMTRHLSRIGFEVRSGRDWFESVGGVPRSNASTLLNPAADHRIAMAVAVAGMVVPGLSVSEPGCVSKSWPGFWETWCRLVGSRP